MGTRVRIRERLTDQLRKWNCAFGILQGQGMSCQSQRWGSWVPLVNVTQCCGSLTWLNVVVPNLALKTLGSQLYPPGLNNICDSLTGPLSTCLPMAWQLSVVGKCADFGVSLLRIYHILLFVEKVVNFLVPQFILL